MIKNWVKLSSKMLQQTRVFSVHVQRMRSPEGSHEDDYYYLDCPNWVNIIPITPDNQVVLIRQYRHGVRGVELEIPGGIVDEGEEPQKTALRELKEETGYVPKEIVPLGFTHPNPALQNNRCFSYLATGCELTSSQNLDPSEDIELELTALEDLPKLLLDGAITHSLVTSAFAFYYLRNKQR